MIPELPANLQQPTIVAANNLGSIQAQNQINNILSRQGFETAPLSSPDLATTPALPKKISQELPSSGDTYPPAVPPAPTPQNTDSTRIPRTYVGPGISFNDGTYFGAITRFPFAEQLSIRPSAVFGNNGGAILRVPITYDFNLGDPEPFEANPLANFHAGGGIEFSSRGGNPGGDKFSLLGTVGVDLALFEGISILADFNTNFSNNTGGTIGMGFEF
jgi:hypothetical protein